MTIADTANEIDALNRDICFYNSSILSLQGYS